MTLPLATPAGSSGNLDFLPDWAFLLLFAVLASIVTVVEYRKWQAGRGKIHLYSLPIPAVVFVLALVAVLVR